MLTYPKTLDAPAAVVALALGFSLIAAVLVVAVPLAALASSILLILRRLLEAASRAPLSRASAHLARHGLAKSGWRREAWNRGPCRSRAMRVIAALREGRVKGAKF
jgi:hypothetical protein